jgi:hypothetical protein
MRDEKHYEAIIALIIFAIIIGFGIIKGCSQSGRSWWNKTKQSLGCDVLVIEKDIYKRPVKFIELKNVHLKSSEQSDGYEYVDKQGQTKMITGSVEIIRGVVSFDEQRRIWGYKRNGEIRRYKDVNWNYDTVYQNK